MAIRLAPRSHIVRNPTAPSRDTQLGSEQQVQLSFSETQGKDFESRNVWVWTSSPIPAPVLSGRQASSFIYIYNLNIAALEPQYAFDGCVASFRDCLLAANPYGTRSEMYSIQCFQQAATCQTCV